MDAPRGAGSVLGHYEIEEPIGQGGFSTVFRARDLRLKRSVILKTLDAPTGAAAERFLREARVLARISHPHVVPVYDSGQDGRVLWFVTADEKAVDLAQWVEARSGSLTLGPAVRVLRDTLRGLRALHQEGIVHRDVKPANVLVRPDGSARITDLGLALEAGRTRLTAPGALVGTLLFLSPEQTLGSDVDHRSDLYQWALVAYWLLHGMLPFPGEDGARRVTRRCEEPIASMASLVPDLPVELARIVDRNLSIRPDDRDASAARMLITLEKPLKLAWDSRPVTPATDSNAPPESTLGRVEDLPGAPGRTVADPAAPPHRRGARSAAAACGVGLLVVLAALAARPPPAPRSLRPAASLPAGPEPARLAAQRVAMASRIAAWESSVKLNRIAYALEKRARTAEGRAEVASVVRSLLATCGVDLGIPDLVDLCDRSTAGASARLYTSLMRLHVLERLAHPDEPAAWRIPGAFAPGLDPGGPPPPGGRCFALPVRQELLLTTLAPGFFPFTDTAMGDSGGRAMRLATTVMVTARIDALAPAKQAWIVLREDNADIHRSRARMRIAGPTELVRVTLDRGRSVGLVRYATAGRTAEWAHALPACLLRAGTIQVKLELESLIATDTMLGRIERLELVLAP